MKRVGIIGSGNVGTNTAFFLAENRVCAVTLVDIKDGVPKGKALDLMEAGPLRGYDTVIDGSSSIDSIAGCDAVVIAAGRVRKLGEHRMDLYRDNAATVKAICQEIRRLTPDAVVINMVEPVDSLTLLAQVTLGFERHRVLGVGGLLSSTRLRYLVSDALAISPREVTALIVGPHRRSMVVLKDTVRVSGIPAATLLGEERLDALIEEVRNAGDTILQMAQWSTAFYAPSAAGCALIEAVVRDTHAVLPVSMRLDGEYGLKDLSVGVPAQIGLQGVEKILSVRMNERERQAFEGACGELRELITQAETLQAVS
jgi:malate dehydrogenase